MSPPARFENARAPKRYVTQSASPPITIPGKRNAVLASWKTCHFS